MFRPLALLAAVCVSSTAIGGFTPVPALAQHTQHISAPSAHAAWRDPPTRVGRLSEFAGEVQLAGEWDDWRPVPRNHPISPGDNLYVVPGGRAEIDLGSVQFWLAGNSALYFERIDDAGVAVRLGSGAMAFRVRGGRLADSVRVALDWGEVTAVRSGFYVIHAPDTTQRGDAAHLMVRSGVAEVDAGGRRHVIVAGRRLAFDAVGVRHDDFVASQGGFEAWAQSRDRRFDLRLERRTARPLEPWDIGLIGIAELDEYGRWDHYAPYGRVWFPNVSIGWAPYRYGHWSYVRPWGWTWIDDAPWGFAATHYGRWVRIGHRWAWCPGSYASRPVYAPALVTFFGGNGWQISISAGPAFAWVPLGWNEPYTPWYSYSPAYWRVVNRPYVRNIAEDPWRPPRYMHASVREAVTSVPVASFLGGRPVAEHRLELPGIDWRSAPPARIHEYVPEGSPWGRPARAQAPAIPTTSGVRPSDAAPVIPGARPPAARPDVAERPGGRPSAAPPMSAPIEPRIWQDPNPVVREAMPERVRRPVAEMNGAPPSERPMMRPPVAREPMTPQPREEWRERNREARPPTPSPVPVPPATREAGPQRVAPAPVVEERTPMRRDGPVASERLLPQTQAPVRESLRAPAAEPSERAAPPADGRKPKREGPVEARP
ncbi:MAG: DUF6600 domain-containing protein [Casimicrobiaceae bacterium]